MNVTQLTVPIPTLKPEDTGDTALRIMEEHHLTELPLVAEENYLGLIQETDLLELDNHNDTLSASHYQNFKPAIIGSAHPYEAIRIANEMNISVLPVVDNEQKYIGAVTRDSFLKYISENSGISSAGRKDKLCITHCPTAQIGNPHSSNKANRSPHSYWRKIFNDVESFFFKNDI